MARRDSAVLAVGAVCEGAVADGRARGGGGLQYAARASVQRRTHAGAARGREGKQARQAALAQWGWVWWMGGRVLLAAVK